MGTAWERNRTQIEQTAFARSSPPLFSVVGLSSLSRQCRHSCASAAPHLTAFSSSVEIFFFNSWPHPIVTRYPPQPSAAFLRPFGFRATGASAMSSWGPSPVRPLSLKERIHRFRIPLSPRGLQVMRVVYFLCSHRRWLAFDALYHFLRSEPSAGVDGRGGCEG